MKKKQTEETIIEEIEFEQLDSLSEQIQIEQWEIIRISQTPSRIYLKNSKEQGTFITMTDEHKNSNLKVGDKITL